MHHAVSTVSLPPFIPATMASDKVFVLLIPGGVPVNFAVFVDLTWFKFVINGPNIRVRVHNTDVVIGNARYTSMVLYPANTKHLYNICTMLDQRRRRWAELYECYTGTNVLCLLVSCICN